MEKGLISKIQEYYFSHHKFADEINRAHEEFFHSSLGEIPENSVTLLHFNEWFLYDFRLQNSRSIVEDFFYSNPYNWSYDRLNSVNDLIKNDYGIYEVMGIALGEGLTLQNIQNQRVYGVREHKATFQLRKGALLWGRVAKVSDHFELVNADSASIDGVAAKFVKDFFMTREDRLTPKIFAKWVSDHSENIVNFK